MNPNKNLFDHLSEWWQSHQARPHTANWSRWLPTPGNTLFTLLMIGLLILTQRAWANNGPSSVNAPEFTTFSVNYQARAANSAGDPIHNPAPGLGMTFTLYDAANGGSALWSETHANVPVTNGLFNVGLGSLNPIPINIWNGDRYLEITIGSETLSPRELIRGVPFAGIAGMAHSVPDGSITSAKIANGSISTEKLQSGTVVNRYYISWYDSETPCTTSSTSWTDCGNTLGAGFSHSFPPPAPGTTRQYRLMVANGDSLSTTGSSYIRVIQTGTNALVHEFDLGRSWSWADYQRWQYSEPITFNNMAHLELQIRVSVTGTLWVYRVWVMAEDVVP